MSAKADDGAAPAPATAKKGYWIVHLLKIHDQEKFFAHLATANSNKKYGGMTRVFAPVSQTLVGEPVEFAALIEFPSVQAAIDCWDDMEDYGAARALLGEDETQVVDRRICVIEADPLPELTPGMGFWLNHVEQIVDEPAFYGYAKASLPCFASAHFGPVVHQFVGKKMVLAAALGCESLQAAIDIYQKPEYLAAKAVGGMEGGESHVVKRTICCVEYDPQYDSSLKQ